MPINRGPSEADGSAKVDAAEQPEITLADLANSNKHPSCEPIVLSTGTANGGFDVTSWTRSLKQHLTRCLGPSRANEEAVAS